MISSSQSFVGNRSVDTRQFIASSPQNSLGNQIPLILLPGLGGDARLFEPQRPAFPELVVPPWIEPKPNESLVDYAWRFAKVIAPGRDCFIGGVSFGGVVALEVATHLETRECYLLGSIRGPNEIPWRLKHLQTMSNLVMIPKWLAPWAVHYGSRWMNPMVRGALAQLNDADARFLRWAAKSILEWKPSAGVAKLHVVQIQGDRDRVFPTSHLTAEKIIQGAGHLVSITNATEVNQFIRGRMSASLHARVFNE